jgi:hypothetical protein
MTTIFKIGDHIKKEEDDQIFKIIDLKEIKGGNWHDGFSVTFVATLEPIMGDNFENPETDTQDFCVQYINYMCQINNLYARRVEE